MVLITPACMRPHGSDYKRGIHSLCSVGHLGINCSSKQRVEGRIDAIRQRAAAERLRVCACAVREETIMWQFSNLYFTDNYFKFLSIADQQIKLGWAFICHTHVFSAFNPSKCTHLEQWAADCAAPGERSWTSCRSQDSNPQPWVTSGFKSNALSIRPTTPPLFNSVV